MQFSIAIVAASASVALAAPSWSLFRRQANACFITGTTALPAIVEEDVAGFQDLVTCDAGTTTIQGIPDVQAGNVKFSSVNFADAAAGGVSPLQFALDTFATTEPLADNDLNTFTNQLVVYLATEAGIRSNGGDVGQIKIPKFFLEMQVSRIRVAQGDTPAEAGLQVDHLRDKVLTNGAAEDQALKDQVTQLAAQTA
ncbi:hypothetical protein VD0002_g3027 [Verticillium dahliae]|uniref:DUF7143 domain-containing protein n=2 Tax=Verticillium dahliae TaxID=27337 RepID=G2X474_VERDV|nr:uncharacterized protein VDAG_04811 [Verticillium dahliae VdLs.17]KAF3351524.1 Carbonyl reductase family member 4 [Verticillium dahliae VDG2]KAH6691967.1 hypothetical protein EV126DRAFT_90581 [Verticillium dahliae]EGY23373.1 hypothetical protein VDAG_04811 [Verticillium dahliae VdLs.17]PNH28565.1 hypothetical protein BJF96_g8131 [Verticillium dahliae]PNH52646.1 hypothetical protein VD0003_g4702 [Verticillium dahliae]